MFAKNDTTGKPKKIKIIDNFGINTSYNVFADSIKWSPVTMSIRTTLFNNFNVSANSSFSLYALDEKGKVYNTFGITANNQLLRLTSFTTSLDFSLSEFLARDKTKNKQDSSGAAVEPICSARDLKKCRRIGPEGRIRPERCSKG